MIPNIITHLLMLFTGAVFMALWMISNGEYVWRAF